MQTACLELLAAATSVPDGSCSSSNTSHSSPSHAHASQHQPSNGSGKSPLPSTSPSSHAQQQRNEGDTETGGHRAGARGAKRRHECTEEEESEATAERRKQTLAALRAALSLLSKAHGKLVDADVRGASLVSTWSDALLLSGRLLLPRGLQSRDLVFGCGMHLCSKCVSDQLVTFKDPDHQVCRDRVSVWVVTFLSEMLKLISQHFINSFMTMCAILLFCYIV